MYLDVVGIYQSETGVTVEQGGGELIEYENKCANSIQIKRSIKFTIANN